jgi:hypothetical protein
VRETNPWTVVMVVVCLLSGFVFGNIVGSAANAYSPPKNNGYVDSLYRMANALERLAEQTEKNQGSR